MNKLKNVFQRSSQKMKTTEDRRPQQFVKRHSSAMVTPIITTDYSTIPLPPPAINLSELSEMEKPAYQSWWKDLDPFDLQKINNENVLKFLNGCSLQDNKLEQVKKEKKKKIQYKKRIQTLSFFTVRFWHCLKPLAMDWISYSFLQCFA